ncbi:hypothetical protein F5141DRAFT_1003094, partial [Pisolithus sp. B1]
PYRTDPDALGIFRVYATRPTFIPHDRAINSISDSPTFETYNSVAQAAGVEANSRLHIPDMALTSKDLFSAFSSPTAGLLMCWHYSGSNEKSVAELTRLTNFTSDVLFNPAESGRFSHERERRLLGAFLQNDSNPFHANHGWYRSTVQVRLPKEKMKFTSEMDPSIGTVKIDVHHRLLVDIIKSAFEDPAASNFHMTPFEEYWKKSNGHTVKLPDDFQDVYTAFYGKASTGEVYTHCKRELIHAIWELLLDEKFMDAYKNGVVVRCGDGITRRIFPRFFSYSADYPEKVLLACIKFLGECPCPRCLVKKRDIPKMGMKRDMLCRKKKQRVDDDRRRNKVEAARRHLFQHGAGLNGQRIKDLLYDESLVPTRNAFSTRLAEFLINFFLLFLVDLLHEFELGVWKAIFTHLLRILIAIGGMAVAEVNWRYRQVPTFGRGTIRRFHKDVAAMKRLAARDFEDLLQIIMDLLFDLAVWHAYAKLRLHTDDTLNFFDAATIALGSSVRTFRDKVCPLYTTNELPQEHAARGRRQARQAAQAPNEDQGGPNDNISRRKPKYLNLHTYKYHALADYPNTIRQMGTTDNYNTQIGELEHRRSKRRYPRSGKQRHRMVSSIANQEVIERFIRKVTHARDKLAAQYPIQLCHPRRSRTSPWDHYHIAKEAGKTHDLFVWLAEHAGDPAVENFVVQLKDHLLACLRDLPYEGDEYKFSDNDRDCVLISDNKLYEHATLRVNYTTYDMRREQDTITPRTHRDIMVLAHEDEQTHPYWYARVVRIFHVDVEYRDPITHVCMSPTRMNFLFVRWFQRDNSPAGWAAKRLQRLEFFDQDNLTDAFGFLDPDCVIRCAHLIPAFAYSTTDEFLGTSFVREWDKDTKDTDHDWRYYYVNCFVDRDMFMRFRGGAVGHKAMRDWDEFLQREGHGVGGNGQAHDNEDDHDGPYEEVASEEDEVDELDDGSDDGKDEERPGDESEEEDDDVRVVADEGEVLDYDIFEAEGYDMP